MSSWSTSFASQSRVSCFSLARTQNPKLYYSKSLHVKPETFAILTACFCGKKFYPKIVCHMLNLWPMANIMAWVSIQYYWILNLSVMQMYIIIAGLWWNFCPAKNFQLYDYTSDGSNRLIYLRSGTSHSSKATWLTILTSLSPRTSESSVARRPRSSLR